MARESKLPLFPDGVLLQEEVIRLRHLPTVPPTHLAECPVRWNYSAAM